MRGKLAFSLLCLLVVLIGCSLNEEPAEKEDTSKQAAEPAVNNKTGLMEDRRIYKEDQVEPVHLYVTILDNDTEETFYDMNNWYNLHNSDEKEPVLPVIIQEGNEEGPIPDSLGSNDTQANASIKVRGNSSKLKAQKSYKIKLYDKAGLWKGQTSLNLNKHVADPTRVKNKLSFDYFKSIPNLTSLRTQFIHLYIKDLSGNQIDQHYQDYGLFTHVEQANERFLSSHGLNPYGNLYKVTQFEFLREPEILKLKDDPSYDEELFERVLEIKAGKDHSNLLNMLEDVNDYSKNINDVVDQYFDKENYLTWMAVNILFGNIDTMSTNYYLYSSVNSEKFYFLPWDYDKAWGWHNDEATGIIPSWQLGLGRYWGSVLHRRFYKNPDNIEALNKKIEELSTDIITPKQTKQLLDQYKEHVTPFVKKQPDLKYLPIHVEDYDKQYYSLVNETENYKKLYYEQLEHPMPIFIESEVTENNKLRFTWDNSYDFQKDDLTYTLQVSSDPAFTNLLIEQKDLFGTSYEIEMLNKGQYFWRVIVKDNKGNEQLPFHIFIDADEAYYWGLKELIIK